MQVFQPGLSIDGGWSMAADGKKQRVTQGAAQYEQKVVQTLRQISGNPAGKALLKLLKLRSSVHSLKLIQFSTKGLKHGEINAITSPSEIPKAVPTGKVVLTAVGQPYQGPHKSVDPVTGQFEWTYGEGGGTAVEIAYTPKLFTHNWGLLGGFRPDEVLFHELIHAFRDIQGHMNMVKISWVSQGKVVGEYLNREEFLATLAGNIYISAKGQGRPLRGSYLHKINVPDSAARNQHGGLKSGYTPSETFVLENLGIVTQLYREEQPLATALGSIDCVFNPFRDYQKMVRGTRT